MKPRITYMYPRRKRVSFTIVAKKHIKELRRRGLDIHEADIHAFNKDDIGVLTLVHPIFYPLIDSPRSYRTILRHSDKLIGFDVCDTDRISHLASYVANLFDCVIVPSTFCKEVYRRSGVFIDIEVLPHGVDDVFLREPREPRDKDVRRIYELKGRKILFFLWHSGFRKGADVVADAFSRLTKEFDNVYLIVKLAGILDPFVQFLYNIPNVILFNKWLDDEDLVDLYDACDIVVVPSRGGGFECVPPDTMIITFNGVKPISEVKVGDFVLTHKGHFKKVVKVFKRKYKGKLVEIKPWGFANFSLKLTPEHPVLAIVRKGKARKAIKDNLKWVEARNLKKGDFIVFPIIQNKSEKIVFDLSKFIDGNENSDNLVIEDEWIYYKATGSPRFTEISYKDIEELTNETKKIVCKAVKAYKGELKATSERVMKVIEFLKKINYKPQHVKIKRFVEFDKNLAKVIGYYLAEGSISAKGHAVEFSFGDEPELVQDLVNAVINAFNYIPSVKSYREGKLTKVIISSKIIVNFIEKLCGKLAHKKHIPIEAYKLDQETLSWLVWTMILGDGCVNRNCIRYVTVNTDLAFGLYILLIRLGYKPNIMWHKSLKQWHIRVHLPYEVKKKSPQNNPLKPRRSDYILHSNKKYLDFEKGYMISLIKDIRIIDYEGYVYNLEVKEDNSYIANLITVHNCNALEGLARGKIVIVSQWGSFNDYCRECLRVSSKKTVDLFLGDVVAKTIHCGRGVEPDSQDLYQKLKYALTMYDVVKKKYERLQRIVRSQYTWDKVGDRLYNIIIRYI